LGFRATAAGRGFDPGEKTFDIVDTMYYVRSMKPIAAAQSKKEARARETQRRILVAATKLFARQGYHKTTISDICRLIDLTSGAVFHHFPSKEALLDAVIDRLARGIYIYSHYLERIETGSSRVVEEMMAIMCDHYRRQPEATICLAALATEFAGSTHPIERRLKDIYNEFVQAFSRVLRHHPRVDDPEAAAIAFLGAVQGIAIQGLLREGEHTIDDLAGAYIALLAHW
jgi:AcrR family transcriptional regulator